MGKDEELVCYEGAELLVRMVRGQICRPEMRAHFVKIGLIGLTGLLSIGIGACREEMSREDADLLIAGDNIPSEDPSIRSKDSISETIRPDITESPTPEPTAGTQGDKVKVDPSPRPTFTPGPSPTPWPTVSPHPALISLATPEYALQWASESPDGRWIVRAGQSESRSYMLESETGTRTEEWLLHRRMLVLSAESEVTAGESILSDWTREGIGAPSMQVLGWSQDSRYLLLYDQGCGDGCGGCGGPLYIYSPEQRAMDKISSSDYATLPTFSDDGRRLAFVEQDQLVVLDLDALERSSATLPMQEYRPLAGGLRFSPQDRAIELDLETDICSDHWMRHTYLVDMESGDLEKLGSKALDFDSP